MSATASPFGFRPANHPTGQSRARPYTIVSGYATNLFRGAPVALDSSNKGTIVAAGTSGSLLGVFWGCEYIDATGKPNESPFWPANQVATNIVAYVYDDPYNVFEVQTDGTGTTTAAAEQTWIGGNMNCVNPTAGSTASGVSTAALASSTLTTGGSAAQFRIIGFSGQMGLTMAGAIANLADVLGDQFLTLQVQIAQHQYLSAPNAV